MTPFTPFSLGNYLCQNVISTGGCGDLYQAIHLPSNGRRAIRMLGSHVIDSPDALETILQTLLRLQTISHPNIITVHEMIRRDYQIFIVTDLIEGFSLAEIFTQLEASGPFTTQVASFIAWQICQALYYAHNLTEDGRPAPLLHGALWPSNILVGLTGEVRLTDFNNWVVPIEAYNLDDAALNSTLSYRSPEHLLQGNLTHNSDLFCVGTLFYQMLTGQPLFQGPATVETIERVKGGDLRQALDPLPANLQPILRRCLAQDPHQRFTDVAAFISELALEVLGVGGQRVREDLVSFLRANMITEEDLETDSMPRPAPLPGSREDEITSISPADMTNLLVALSRERTDTQLRATSIPELQHKAEGTEEIENSQIENEEFASGDYESEELEDEATVVDVLIPPALAEGGQGDGRIKAEDTSVTQVGPTEEPRGALAGDAPHHAGELEAPSPDARGIPAALFPPQEQTDPGGAGAPIREVPTDSVTTRAERPLQLDQLGPASLEGTYSAEVDDHWEAPPIDSPQVAFQQDDIPTHALKKSPENRADLEALKLTPLPLPSEMPASSMDIFESPSPAPSSQEESPPQETYTSEAVTASSPMTGPLTAPPSSDPGTAPTLHDLNRDPEEKNLLDLARGGAPQGSEHDPSSGVDGSFSGVDSSFDSSMSSFDSSMSSFSESGSRAPAPISRSAPRSRFTAAHLLLIFAIIIFLVALSLLIRRLFFQAPPPAVVTDASRPLAPTGDAPAKEAPTARKKAPAPKPDQRPARPPRDMAVKPVTPPEGAPAVEPRETGKHLDKLLHGRAKAGQLQIDSTPSGMAFVSGKQVGMTPVIANPGPGKKVPVVILTRGFKMFRQVVRTSAERALQINIKLSPAGYERASKRSRGILNVICHRKDRRQIFINGESTGFSCPKVGFFLRPGRHKVGVYTVKRDRFRTYTVRVTRNRRRIIRVPR